MDVHRIVDVVDRTCPFLNREEPVCAGRFSLRQVGMMFGYCVGQPESCPPYHRLLRERPERAQPQPVITLTVHGRAPEPSYGYAAA
ncbi:MAG: hypothetical protein ACOC1G_06295 [Phycisphaeraceae bacterium]